jgi:hypothetical protein
VRWRRRAATAAVAGRPPPGLFGLAIESEAVHFWDIVAACESSG